MIKVEMISPPPKHVISLCCFILAMSALLSFWLDWMLLLNHDWNSLNRPPQSAKPKDLEKRKKESSTNQFPHHDVITLHALFSIQLVL
jgi:hypothetical protein